MAESLDVSTYAPAFTVKIEGTELDDITARSIDQISITKKMGQADGFRFNVVDKSKTGGLKILDNKLFKVGNKIAITIGFQSGKSNQMQGHIEVMNAKFSNGDMQSLEISGKDKNLAVLQAESEYKCYTKKKDSDIVKAIAGEVGLTPEVDATSGEAPEKKEKKGGTSYYNFIQKMVKQNLGFEFMVTDGKLVFRKSKVKDSPTVTLEWGQHLQSFEPREDLSKIITGVTVRWTDQLKRESIIGTASTSDETAVGSGKTAGKIAQGVYGDKEREITDEPVDSATEAKNLAISTLCDTNKELVTAEVKTFGTPEAEPGVMVEVKGMGDKYSGKYYVYSAVHTIDNSGYHSNFSVRRNTIP